MKKAERPSWSGRTVICLASGPSLTPEDCELVRRSGHVAIAVNTTFRLAPWADVIFGMDVSWWRAHHREVQAVCSGRKISTSHAARSYGAETLWQEKWFPHCLNSGAGALALAIGGRAAKAVLLGFDAQLTGGRAHWHGDHPRGCGNASAVHRWAGHFKSLAKDAAAAGCLVVNASRETAIPTFPRVALEEALA